jgi:exosortase/archaeosortase family protein
VKAALSFPVRFAILLAAFAALGQSSWFSDEVRVPVCRALARATGLALSAAGIAARVEGDVVTAGGFSASVHPDCDGLVLLGLFLAAALAFPVPSWRRALPSTLAALAALIVLNWLRVVALVLTGYLDRELFDLTHVYAWQGALILGTMVVWLMWANRVARVGASEARSEAH